MANLHNRMNDLKSQSFCLERALLSTDVHFKTPNPAAERSGEEGLRVGSHLSQSGLTLSEFQVSVIEREFKVNLTKLILNEHVYVQALVPLRTDNLDRLFDKIYNEMKDHYDVTHQFPTDLERESSRKHYVGIFISSMVGFIKKNYSFTNSSELIYGNEEVLTITINDESVTGKADFVIQHLDAALKKRIHLVVFEAKRHNCYLELAQCVAYLRTIYNRNADNRRVFGFCTTGSFWSLVSYDKANGYRLHQKERLLFPRMFEDETYKEHWMQNCTLVPRILFSVLAQQLALPN